MTLSMPISKFVSIEVQINIGPKVKLLQDMHGLKTSPAVHTHPPPGLSSDNQQSSLWRSLRTHRLIPTVRLPEPKLAPSVPHTPISPDTAGQRTQFHNIIPLAR